MRSHSITQKCPKCRVPLRVEMQDKHVKIDGVWIAVPGENLCTCDNPDCPRVGITLNPAAIRELTDEQAANYPRSGSYPTC